MPTTISAGVKVIPIDCKITNLFNEYEYFLVNE